MIAPGPQLESPSKWKVFISKLAGRVADLVVEFVATFVAIAGIAVADLLVKWWLGDDKKFFGIVPVHWVFDVGHVSLIGRLIYRVFYPEKVKDE